MHRSKVYDSMNNHKTNTLKYPAPKSGNNMTFIPEVVMAPHCSTTHPLKGNPSLHL